MKKSSIIASQEEWTIYRIRDGFVISRPRVLAAFASDSNIYRLTMTSRGHYIVLERTKNILWRVVEKFPREHVRKVCVDSRVVRVSRSGGGSSDAFEVSLSLDIVGVVMPLKILDVHEHHAQDTPLIVSACKEHIESVLGLE